MSWLTDFLARCWQWLVRANPSATKTSQKNLTDLPLTKPAANSPMRPTSRPIKPVPKPAVYPAMQPTPMCFKPAPKPFKPTPRSSRPAKPKEPKSPYSTRQIVSDARRSKEMHEKAAKGLIPSSLGLASGLDDLIFELPTKSLDDLRLLWLAAIKREDDAKSEQLRQALLAEWATRARHAKTPAEYFRWPSTSGGNGGGASSFDTWNQQGLLRFFGYQVGATGGLRTPARRHILDAVFVNTLPPVNGPEYIEDWGTPRSTARLKRLAEEIARFVRNAKNKRNANMEVAVSDWEEDLRYLRERYYRVHFGFGWPR